MSESLTALVQKLTKIIFGMENKVSLICLWFFIGSDMNKLPIEICYPCHLSLQVKPLKKNKNTARKEEKSNRDTKVQFYAVSPGCWLHDLANQE